MICKVIVVSRIWYNYNGTTWCYIDGMWCVRSAITCLHGARSKAGPRWTLTPLTLAVSEGSVLLEHWCHLQTVYFLLTIIIFLFFLHFNVSQFFFKQDGMCIAFRNGIINIIWLTITTCSFLWSCLTIKSINQNFIIVTCTHHV